MGNKLLHVTSYSHDSMCIFNRMYTATVRSILPYDSKHGHPKQKICEDFRCLNTIFSVVMVAYGGGILSSPEIRLNILGTRVQSLEQTVGID